jgi:hypothetical protein
MISAGRRLSQLDKIQRRCRQTIGGRRCEGCRCEDRGADPGRLTDPKAGAASIDWGGNRELGVAD